MHVIINYINKFLSLICKIQSILQIIVLKRIVICCCKTNFVNDTDLIKSTYNGTSYNIWEVNTKWIKKPYIMLWKIHWSSFSWDFEKFKEVLHLLPFEIGVTIYSISPYTIYTNAILSYQNLKEQLVTLSKNSILFLNVKALKDSSLKEQKAIVDKRTSLQVNIVMLLPKVYGIPEKIQKNCKWD